jgi:hypothetical protein
MIDYFQTRLERLLRLEHAGEYRGPDLSQKGPGVPNITFTLDDQDRLFVRKCIFSTSEDLKALGAHDVVEQTFALFLRRGS